MSDAPPSPTSKSTRRAVAGLLIVALAGGLWIERSHLAPMLNELQGSSQAAAAKPPVQAKGVPVTLTTARQGEFPLYLDGLGTVQALNTVTVRAQVTGQLIKIGFTQGHMVNKGDLLAQIDPRTYEAALAQASGQLARDQAALKGAQLDLERDAVLVKQKALAQQTQDDQAALVGQDQGTVQADQAAVQAAQVNLAYCRIVSPVTGRAGFRLVDEGNLVQPADAGGIVSIDQVQPISVVFPVAQDQIPAIGKALDAGQAPVLAMAEDGHTILSKGTLSYTNNQVDAATGTISLKATFANEDNALWPGQSVTVRLLLNTLKDVTLISEDAVQHGPDGLFAYVSGDDDKAQMRPIKVAQTGNGQTVVSDGIKPGDKTVTDGAYGVQPGVLLDATINQGTPQQVPPPAGIDTAQTSSTSANPAQAVQAQK
ncbi:efflux RND transporter periplasmic adaptor subunit [Mesorhizobium loti]|uniref:Efflux RND transporter periplasmic adaptor subunit n=1 Tax=Mesorhizobium loti R88b TaxID=935548 RepID=A0A6M7WT28_RHILI|nr:efflux RND transporter periplasmic adaptor subunit [Mesorhizobium loti]QKD02151.1 efflux RND transporter periplasmic adaptor subunit [Mesorhizobium loti R88b]